MSEPISMPRVSAAAKIALALAAAAVLRWGVLRWLRPAAVLFPAGEPVVQPWPCSPVCCWCCGWQG